MKKIAMVTGIWKRPEVFQMFAEGCKMLQEYFKDRIEIVVCVSGSEGNKSKELVTSQGKGFYYVEIPNQPLSIKINTATLLAKAFKPDYCLMLGSDDLIGINLIEEYLIFMNRGIDYIYLLDYYFYDTTTKKGLYWGGYRQKFNKGHACGAGRVISKRLLDLMKWQPWPTGFDRILDTGFDKKLSMFPHSKQAILLRDKNLFGLDIKSSENMTPFNLWDNSEYLDGKKLLFDNLPEKLASLIYK